MKKTDYILKDFFSKMNVESLRSLCIKLDQRSGPDLAECLQDFSKSQDLDKWLSSAKSSEDLYDMVDLIQEYAERELDKKLPEMMRV